MVGALEFRLLGPVDLTIGDDSVLPGSSRQRDLLTLLVLDANQVVSTDRLIHRLWDGEPPATATAALQVYVAKLRKVLTEHRSGPRPSIATVGGGYRLEVDEDSVDARCFEELLARGRSQLRSGSAHAAAATLAAALGLWRGDAFADARHLEGVRIEAIRLEELRAAALGDRIDADLELGKHSELVAELESLVNEQPLRERHWGQLMTALYRDGRQADALRTYRRASDALGEELGIEPGPELRDLEERILLQDDALLLAPDDEPPPTNLQPQLTRFIGRHRELQGVIDLTNRQPLVTLTGPGGCGKTRLAREAGEAVLSAYRDGVWFVDLAPLPPGAGVAPAAAAALGATPDTDETPIDALRRHLAGKHLLLILDNCEHVVEACADLIANLPSVGRGTCVLATSRQRLNVAGETSWTVPPMQLPPPGSDPETTAETDAVALFLDRARQRAPTLEADAATLDAAGRICRDLDGLPLAIELAAARAGVLSVAEIADRLGERLSLLTRGDRGMPHRHVALRKTIQWSYDLLDDSERRLFDRLSVFNGGFTLDAGEAIGDAGDLTLDLLGGLLEKSLLTADMAAGRPTRYRSLETLREFAASQLEAHGTAGEVEALHAAFYLAMAREAAGAVGGPDETAAFNRLEADLDNLRAVLERSISTDVATAVAMAESLSTFWMNRGHAAEGRRLLRRLLERHHNELTPELLASAEWVQGVLAYAVDDYEAARVSMESALAAARGLDASERTARLINGLGVLALQRGDYGLAREHYEEAASLFQTIGDDRGLATAELNQGIAALNLDDLDAAHAAFERAERRFASIGDDRETAHCLHRLAFVHELQSDPDRALALHHRALDINRRLGNKLGLADSTLYTADTETYHGSPDTAAALLLEALALFVELDAAVGVARTLFTTAALALRRGDVQSAAVLCGAHDGIRRAAGAPVPAANRAAHDDLIASTVERLGQPEVDVLMSRGTMMGREAAVDCALRVLHAGPVAQAPSSISTM